MPAWRAEIFLRKMQIKLFTIPVTDSGAFVEEMNRFLRANKILEVENHLAHHATGAFWCFCVKYIESAFVNQGNDKGKIDYKNELDEATFGVFSKLREARKQIATEEAIPAYAVCTDSELAEMAKLPEINISSLGKVKGFGEKKKEKYGNRLINHFNQINSGETGGKLI